jgi:hypothetical protein
MQTQTLRAIGLLLLLLPFLVTLLAFVIPPAGLPVVALLWLLYWEPKPKEFHPWLTYIDLDKGHEIDVVTGEKA